jgi:hypothetical protein
MPGEPQMIRTYAEFWPTYVNAHRHPVTRTLHFIGTSLAILCLIAGFISPWWMLAAPVIAYAFAWVGHFRVEKNTPATFGHPIWSLISDLKMYGLMWLGRMAAETERLGDGL